MRLGADVGGTFTDIILVDDQSGLFTFGKVLTTPDQPDDAVIEGVKQVTSALNGEAAAISHLVHGTTLFTNALIERKGSLTALGHHGWVPRMPSRSAGNTATTCMICG